MESGTVRALVALSICSTLILMPGQAGAVPTTPPAGYTYTSRQAMVASTHVTFSDPALTSDGYHSGTIESDGAGTAITIVSHPDNANFYTPIDYYFRFPYTLSSGAPDTSQFTFDLKDINGEFAGYSESFTWSDNGSTWYYFYQEVNGEGHYVYFSTDGNGNVNQSTVVQTRATQSADKCNIISDWGALQCPREFSAIIEIPTKVRSFLARIGWFDSALSWTWNHLESAGNQLVTWLKDPTVIYALTVVGIAAGAIVCCASTDGFGCAACAVSAFALEGAAMGTYGNTDVPTITNTSQVRSGGLILCAAPNCDSQCGVNYLTEGVYVLCAYKTTTGTCVSPYGFSNPDNCMYGYWE